MIEKRDARHQPVRIDRRGRHREICGNRQTGRNGVQRHQRGLVCVIVDDGSQAAGTGQCGIHHVGQAHVVRFVRLHLRISDDAHGKCVLRFTGQKHHMPRHREIIRARRCRAVEAHEIDCHRPATGRGQTQREQRLGEPGVAFDHGPIVDGQSRGRVGGEYDRRRRRARAHVVHGHGRQHMQPGRHIHPHPLERRIPIRPQHIGSIEKLDPANPPVRVRCRGRQRQVRRQRQTRRHCGQLHGGRHVGHQRIDDRCGGNAFAQRGVRRTKKDDVEELVRLIAGVRKNLHHHLRIRNPRRKTQDPFRRDEVGPGNRRAVGRREMNAHRHIGRRTERDRKDSVLSPGIIVPHRGVKDRQTGQRPVDNRAQRAVGGERDMDRVAQDGEECFIRLLEVVRQQEHPQRLIRASGRKPDDHVRGNIVQPRQGRDVRRAQFHGNLAAGGLRQPEHEHRRGPLNALRRLDVQQNAIVIQDQPGGLRVAQQRHVRT